MFTYDVMVVSQVKPRSAFLVVVASTKETEEVTETALHRTRLRFSFRN